MHLMFDNESPIQHQQFANGIINRKKEKLSKSCHLEQFRTTNLFCGIIMKN